MVLNFCWCYLTDPKFGFLDVQNGPKFGFQLIPGHITFVWMHVAISLWYYYSTLFPFVQNQSPQIIGGSNMIFWWSFYVLTHTVWLILHILISFNAFYLPSMLFETDPDWSKFGPRWFGFKAYFWTSTFSIVYTIVNQIKLIQCLISVFPIQFNLFGPKKFQI